MGVLSFDRMVRVRANLMDIARHQELLSAFALSAISDACAVLSEAQTHLFNLDADLEWFDPDDYDNDDVQKLYRQARALTRDANLGHPDAYGCDRDGTGSLHMCAKGDLGAIPLYAGSRGTEHQYALRLLQALMEKHYPDRSPEWQPLPDLMGVLTQIDNLTTGLVRASPPQEAEKCRERD